MTLHVCFTLIPNSWWVRAQERHQKLFTSAALKVCCSSRVMVDINMSRFTFDLHGIPPTLRLFFIARSLREAVASW